MRRRTEAEAHRTFYELKTDRLQFEALLQDDLTALHDRDLRCRELDVRQARRPIRIRATRFSSGRSRRGCRGEASAEVPILDLRRWNGGLRAGRDRRFVLARGGVATLVGAEGGGGSGSLHRNGDIAVPETGDAKTSPQCRSLIRKVRRSLFEVDTGRVGKWHRNGPDK